MELPPPHVLLQLDAIIVAQRESDGARVVATASAAATPPRPVSRWHGEVKERAPAPAPAAEPPKQKSGSKWTPDEDAALRRLHAEHKETASKWDVIAAAIGTGRTASAAEHRWGLIKDNRAIACLQENPKRDQSKSWVRYEAYKSATTVVEFLEKGGTPADLKHDVGKGFVWYLDAEDFQEDGRELSAAKKKKEDPDFVPKEPVARGLGGGAPKPVEMRRIGDAAWQWFASRTDAAKAFRVTTNDVGYLLREPSKASRYACEFEARPAPAPKKRERPTYRSVEGAKPKTNGKWRSGLFPGREFDDLDEYRAAKKQREERREDYRAQARDNRCHAH